MIELRAACASDVPAMTRVMEEAFDPRFGEAWSATQLLGAIAMERNVADLAVIDAQPVGFSLARVAGYEAELLLVAVRPPWRRRGVAARLIGALLDRLKRNGSDALYLEVRDGNLEALDLYRQHGFTAVGRRPAYYAGANRRRFDAITMRLVL